MGQAKPRFISNGARYNTARSMINTEINGSGQHVTTRLTPPVAPFRTYENIRNLASYLLKLKFVKT